MRPGRSAVVLLSVLCACTRPSSRQDAPGTYVLHLRGAADTLWVHPDGTYVHRYAANGAPPVIVRGTWEFQPVGGDPSVVFQDFPSRTTLGLPPEQLRRTRWPAFIRRTASGAVVLPVNLDTRLQYHRISTRMLGSGGSE